VPDGERIFNLAALVVLCSIVLHGVTDTPGSEWMARRAEDQDADSRYSSGSAKGATARPSTSVTP
jgi:hypothetical protein